MVCSTSPRSCAWPACVAYGPAPISRAPTVWASCTAGARSWWGGGPPTASRPAAASAGPVSRFAPPGLSPIGRRSAGIVRIASSLAGRVALQEWMSRGSCGWSQRTGSTRPPGSVWTAFPCPTCSAASASTPVRTRAAGPSSVDRCRSAACDASSSTPSSPEARRGRGSPRPASGWP